MALEGYTMITLRSPLLPMHPMLRTTTKVLFATALLAAIACNDNNPTGSEGPTGAEFTLSQAQVSALIARADQLADANPTNPAMRSLVDSTLLALQAGVVMKRVDVQTDLTTAPLYFIGIHRVIQQPDGGSFSTWTLVGIEDPTDFTTVVQVTGFAQSTTSTAPSSVSGTIGDGTGIVNGRLLQVGAGNVLKTWNYSTGNASFTSEPPTGACPNGNPEQWTVCTLENVRVTFSITATESLTSSFARHASVNTEVSVPTIRLTYTPGGQ
jgi:hypothetical protein